MLRKAPLYNGLLLNNFLTQKCHCWQNCKHSLKLILCSNKYEHQQSYFLCLTSGNSGSDCVNRSVADRGSRAMIGLRICAFSSDFKVTKIYNQMSYDTLVQPTQSSRQTRKCGDICLTSSSITGMPALL